MQIPGHLRPGRCERCFFPLAQCLCAEVPRVETRTRVIILRHVHEAWRLSNTGRLAALALPNLELHNYGLRPDLQPPLPTLPQGTWLLYPDESATPVPAPPPTGLLVLDGTWTQARRMLHRLPFLRALPRLSFATAPEGPRQRIPPHPGGMSTLEAIAEALAVLEGEGAAQPLRDFHRLLAERAIRLRGLDPEAHGR